MRRPLALFTLALAASACSSSSDDAVEAPAANTTPPDPPAGNVHNQELAGDQRCPGDPACAAADDPALYVGVAVEDISPVVDHVVLHAPGSNPWDFHQGSDQCVDKATQQLAPNTACTWMAGFGTGRAAVDVADPTSVRCVVMRQGATKVGLCSVDAVGWFYDEIVRTRAILPAEVDLDLLVVAATHLHETRDTLGIWGYDDGVSGVSLAYNQMVREKTRDALVAANAKLEAVKVQLGAIQVDGHVAGTDPKGLKTNAFVSDTRDPVVIDAELRTIRFVGKTGGTVATLVNWSSHPEFAGSENVQITADWVGGLRDAVEKGIDEVDPDGKPLHWDGLGGTAIVFNGALGGQVGPGEVKVYGFDGKLREPDGAVPGSGIDKARTSGRTVAAYALESLKNGATLLETAPLGFRARELYLDVINEGYHIALAEKLFDREAKFDPTKPLGPDNIPLIKTQEAVIDIGPAELLTIPGEMHAELLLATREGKTSVEAPYPFTPAPYLVLNDKVSNPNCDVDGHSRCDDGPPAIDKLDRTQVIDLFRDPKATYRWVIGLGQDELGYVVPSYDYKLDAVHPYLNEATPGDHYEETNSVGPNVEHDMVAPMRQLLATPKVVTR